MSKPWKIIQELETDNSRLFKESVVEKNINDKKMSQKREEKFVTNESSLNNMGSAAHTAREKKLLRTKFCLFLFPF